MKKLIAIQFLLFCVMPLVIGQDLLTVLRDIVVKKECKTQVVDFLIDLSNCMHYVSIEQNVTANPGEAVKAICDPNFRKCIDEFEKKLKPCVKNEDLVKGFDEQEKAVTGLLKYACKDDGKPLTDFFQNGIKCFAEKSITDKISSCAHPQQLQHYSYTIYIQIILYNLQDDVMCKEAGKQSLCVLDALEDCSTKEARNFIGGGLWESLRSTRCKTIIEKDYSPINSGVSVTFNLFLLIPMAFVAKICF